MSDKNKVRTVFLLDPADRNALEKLSAKTGAPVAELIRRAIQEWLKKHGKGAEK